jgi:kynurenine formamidase
MTRPRFSRVFDLGRPLEAATPVAPGHPPFRMALLRRHGDLVRADGGSSANELISTSGHTGTHIDAFAHFSKSGRVQGGEDAYEASRGARFRILGVETIEPIVTRGVLIDVARVEGADGLEAGRAITADDCEKALKAEGVGAPGEGEAVLFRTGWPVGRYPDEKRYGGWDGAPGPDLGAARWLADHRVKVAGADTLAFEHIPNHPDPLTLPVHVHLLVETGVHIIEVLDLEELAAAQVYEFLFVCAPLKIVGATGSPVRPLALVPAS